MKRRNADCSKLRRPLKRNRITEGIYGSTFLYLKFLVVWALVLLADFVLEFRFEYLWPFWLFIRSVYDSFRYQGLAFSVFFVCVAFTSDIICLLFIPVQWLFFAASTYVWVQYVWHTERGVCLPTVSLWILFVYIEAAIRFKDLKDFHVDLCRPFAAHCIGYPVVTLGFGFKSYVSYKMRLRKQKEVQKENEFYMQLLQQALPPEQQMLQKQEREAEEAAAKSAHDADSPLTAQNGSAGGKKPAANTLPELEYREKERGKGESKKQHNQNQNHHSNILPVVDYNKAQELEYMENNVNSKRLSSSELLGSTENLLLKEDTSSSSCSSSSSNSTSSKNHKNANAGGGVGGNSSPRGHGTANGSVPSSTGPSSSSGKGEKKQKCGGKGGHRDPTDNCIPNNQLGKPEALVRLEQDVKKLKAELQASRQTEQDLRSQLGSLGTSERSIRSELGQLRQDNELLQNKLHNAVQAKQKDKQTMGQLEKRLKTEQEARAAAERQLAEEKKRKKLEEATAARAVALAAASRGECTDSLRRRISELETECKKLTLDIKVKEDLIRELELKVQELHKYKENEKDTEVLMSALSAMQDKTQHLENSLSAETRIKLDLFSALGDAKRQLEIAQGQILQKDQEIKDLKQKIAEVMAVMPSIAYSTDTSNMNPVTPHYSSKFMDTKLPENWTDTRETLLEGMVFQLKYLGVTLVEQPKGEELSAAAVKRIVATAKASGKKLQKVMLKVSPRGIILYDSVSNQLIENVSIYRISYCTADKMHDKVFAYIAQSQRNETLECHAFLCSKKKVAQAVTLTVAQAFKVAFEFWQNTKEEKRVNSEPIGSVNPPSPKSQCLEEEEVATGNLLNLEETAVIHAEQDDTPHSFSTENNNIVWELDDGLDEAFSRLAECRANPQVLDTGLNPQDYNADECLSPCNWDKTDGEDAFAF
ncbi:Macoilin-2 [Bagarius yarrelli]|uniref:Macoilin-2 n=1 Tax=Bagarius yarrelli TaxID=175774 RepID=A0A556V435_BAGYA|nr:Macoilin-2 [Bagarius yarrelli]